MNLQHPQNVAELLQRAVEQAFIAQFGGLFSVLCAAENPELGLERFERGLKKLLDTSREAAATINSLEEGLT